MRSICSYFITLSLIVTATVALSAHAKEPLNPNPSVYIDSKNPMLDVQIALDAAKSADKLLLIVMGAQWCHDSRGFAAKSKDPDVAKVLADSYETVFVDVGYFKDLRAVSQRFDQAHYFATPTVMIIDPGTERLLNAGDMHIWGSADQLPTSTYLDYFTAYADNPAPQFVPLPDMHTTAISAFEEQNAQRLTNAYSVLAPGLKAEDSSGEAGDEFMQQWREVRRYRTTLQKDIQSIRKQAIESPDKSLIFPSYDDFSWEDGF